MGVEARLQPKGEKITPCGALFELDGKGGVRKIARKEQRVSSWRGLTPRKRDKSAEESEMGGDRARIQGEELSFILETCDTRRQAPDLSLGSIGNTSRGRKMANKE